MNDRRAWKNKGAVESERRMDERVKAIAARERAAQELDGERWGLVVEEPGVGSQCVPNFTKERKP